MKTNSIALRVADFLKDYPPFEYMSEEDLLAFAAQGRVRFHEKDEYVFEQDTPRTPWVYVVASGTVEVVKKSDEGEELFDMRGPGDLLGISWFFSDKLFVHSARAMTDVLLYAFPWSALRAAMQKYAALSRYLAAYFSINPNYRLPDPQDGQSSFPTLPSLERTGAASAERPALWLTDTGALTRRSRQRMIACTPATTVREAAALMVNAGQDAGIVADASGRPLGIFSQFDFCNALAQGRLNESALIDTLMTAPVFTVRDTLDAGELILEMLKRNVRYLCLTEDGTPDSPALGLVTERALQLLHGRLPMFLGRELRRAADEESLAALRARADEHVREYLETHLPLKWICDFVATMDTLVVQRALELAQKQLLAELPEAHRPSVKWCWLFFGQCARKEALLRAAQESGILYEDPAPDQQESTRGWFLRLGARVAHILEVCGFARGPLSADRSENVRALSQWVSRFERCTHEFCEDEQLESCLPYFDMRAVAGSTQLPDQLHERWKNSFTSGDFFLQRLARAALENLPPLTIFKNAIVDTDGEVDTRLDIVRNILQPLADCARVLAYAQGFARIVPSMERLSAVAEQLPEKKDLLLEAAEAFRVALYHRAICATRHGDDGRFLIPSELNKIDQELFKSVFRTIDELFKYMRARFGVPEEDGD